MVTANTRSLSLNELDFKMITTGITCASYSATSTLSATTSFVTCPISQQLCPGQQLTISGCNACSGDQYLILTDSNGNQKAFDDDGCDVGSKCSLLTYSLPISVSSCQSLVIQEGCYSTTSCSGTVTWSITGEICTQGFINYVYFRF